MRYAYIRVSSQNQNVDRQVEAMSSRAIDRFFVEKASAKDTDRPQLQALLNILQPKDTIVVDSLDRLSRNYDDIKKLWHFITVETEAYIEIIDLPILSVSEDTTLENKVVIDVVLSMLGYVAENERTKIKERQREGIAIARQKGRYRGRVGRKCKLSRLDYLDMKAAIDNNSSVLQVCRSKEVSSTTFYKAKLKYEKKIENINEETYKTNFDR